MYKLAFSIKKYNAETKKSDFYKDINKIFSQKILFRIDNFAMDLELENEIKISSGLDKFNKIYKKKSSSLANQNFIITLSVLNENFFNEIHLDEFQNKLYSILNSYLDILSFTTAKDGLGDITFYIICSATVKKIFLPHILNKVIESGKKPDELTGALSYNLILGGNMSEKPEQKFIDLVLSELNTKEYNLTSATEIEKQKYILDSYNRANNIINNLHNDINTLFEYLISANPKYQTYLKSIIESKKLNTLNQIINKL